MLDKASMLLGVVENGPASSAELVNRTGLSRPTVHRIAKAMERLGLLTRDLQGRFVLGPRLGTLMVEAHGDRLLWIAAPALRELAGLTGFDVRLFRRRGSVQICVAAERSRTAGGPDVPIGAAQPAKAGPVAQTLFAWEAPEEIYEGLRGARFGPEQLAEVRRRGWIYGPDTAGPDTRTVAVPVRVREGRVVAALALSGPAARLTAGAGRMLSGAAIDTAIRIGDALHCSYANDPGARVAG
ncbi:IclR family transcriptional regulator [Streptomyces cinnamoneus]|uniref:IclR family transcriptional regulator n=1 Tax=Streptomyces cinnamoneus TaxID=53446 RepID=UPI001E46B6D3|nr:helix-turn-helix domain-containing protein [Streptomyces cinnamoneus]